jgi:hypothetical protein
MDQEETRMPAWLRYVLWIFPVVIAVATGAYTIILAVLGHLESVKKSDDERIKLANAQVLQAQEPFLRKQLELYSEVLKEVEKLVTLAPTDKEWISSELRFWQLYLSELSMVESGDVEGAMVRFGGQLNVYKKGGQNLQTLETCSYELAHAVRRSIQARWQVKQSEAIGVRCPQPDHTVSRGDGVVVK